MNGGGWSRDWLGRGWWGAVGEMEHQDRGEAAAKPGGEVEEKGSNRSEIEIAELQKVKIANSSVLPDLDLLLSDCKGEVDNVTEVDKKLTPCKRGKGGEVKPDMPGSKGDSARRKSSSSRPSGLAALKAAKRAEMAAKAKEGEAQSKEGRVGKMRGPTGLAYSPDMLLHTCTWDSNHIESPARLERVMARCQEMGLVEKCSKVSPREATDQELLCYHDQEFLDTMAKSRVMAEEEAEGVCKGLDSVYLCPHTDRAARLAAGGAIDLVKGVLEGSLHNGIGLVR